MAWFACHPNHTIWREIGVCVCPDMCVWGHLVSRIYPTDCMHTHMCAQAHAHHSISHLNKCATMLGTVEESKNQHLTYSAAESKLLRKSCTYHGQSNTNNSFASPQNYSWEGSFCVHQLWCLYFISARLTAADNWTLASASLTLLVVFQHHTSVAFRHTLRSPCWGAGAHR